MSALSEHYGRLSRMTEAERDAEIKRQVFGSAFAGIFVSDEILKGNADLVPAQHDYLTGSGDKS